MIFLLAVVLHWLMWQDNYQTVSQSFGGLGYEAEARRILRGGGILFFSESPANGDARGIIHPPGYSILMALLQSVTTNWADALIMFQIIVNSLAAVVVLLIATELLAFPAAVISGLLVALSPHFAYYALIRSPDSLAVFPLLTAVYCLAHAYKLSSGVHHKDRASFPASLFYVALAGFWIGASCWLRPNAMLLSPLLALLLVIGLSAFNLKQRLWTAMVLMMLTGLVIAPITVRNWLVYREFIPISIGVGVNLLEGMADYDFDHRWNLPGRDEAVAAYDAQLYQRPEYGRNMWTPDGIARDRERVRIAQRLIRQQPTWFATVMATRAAFMLRSNGGKGTYPWPQNTALVPIIAATPGVGALAEPLPTEQSPLPLNFQPLTPAVQIIPLAKVIAPTTNENTNNPLNNNNINKDNDNNGNNDNKSSNSNKDNKLTPSHTLLDPNKVDNALATSNATVEFKSTVAGVATTAQTSPPPPPTSTSPVLGKASVPAPSPANTAPTTATATVPSASVTNPVASAALAVSSTQRVPYSQLLESAEINLVPYHNYLITLELTDLVGTLGVKVVAGKQELANQLAAPPLVSPINSAIAGQPTNKVRKARQKAPPSQTAPAVTVVTPEVSSPAAPLTLPKTTTNHPNEVALQDKSNDKAEKNATTTPTSEVKQLVKLYLASDRYEQCRVLITQDSATMAQFKIQQLAITPLGPTTGNWSRYGRPVLRALQKNIFVTTYLLSFVALGLGTLLLAQRGMVMGLLLTIPGYFLTAQAVLHTEYRYILAIHYFLLIFAALGMVGLVKLLRLLIVKVRARVRPVVS